MNACARCFVPFVFLLLTGCVDDIDEALRWKNRYEEIKQVQKKLEGDIDSIKGRYAQLEGRYKALDASYAKVASENGELKRRIDPPRQDSCRVV